MLRSKNVGQIIKIKISTLSVKIFNIRIFSLN